MLLRCRGFRFGAVPAGIKSSGALDLAIMSTDELATAAAVFTRNRFKAAPVQISQRALRMSGGRARAIIVNSGNANACTGADGLRDARRMAALTGEELGIAPEHVLVSSTGIIGVPLPMPQVEAGIHGAARALKRSGFERFSEAILTTDKQPKTATRVIRVGGARVTLVGCTKGAGMIAPNMATTLTFVATDARIGAAALQAALAAAVEPTFNAITVDGDTSTNDMVAIMASGAAGNKSLRGRDAEAFTAALTELLGELARALMHGGEGVHHVVSVRVRGAKSVDAARTIAARVANSPLVKTAIAGRDPNWGRVLAGVGNAGVPLDPRRVDLWFEDVQAVRGGAAATSDRDALEAGIHAVMSRPSYEIVIDLHAGGGEACFLACDLSHEYVSINADYRT